MISTTSIYIILTDYMTWSLFNTTVSSVIPTDPQLISHPTHYPLATPSSSSYLHTSNSDDTTTTKSCTSEYACQTQKRACKQRVGAIRVFLHTNGGGGQLLTPPASPHQGASSTMAQSLLNYTSFVVYSILPIANQAVACRSIQQDLPTHLWWRRKTSKNPASPLRTPLRLQQRNTTISICKARIPRMIYILYAKCKSEENHQDEKEKNVAKKQL